LNVLSLGLAEDRGEVFKALVELISAPAGGFLLLFKLAGDLAEALFHAVEGLLARGIDYRCDALLSNTGSGSRTEERADFGGAFIELRTGFARGR
jgi:hypothetical protein